MVYLIFLLAAIITVVLAVRLSTYADVLSKRTSLGGMMVGTILLAGATSLPELTTSATAIYVNNPNIAVGNVLGSNLFNLLILAVFDVIYRKNKMLTSIENDHVITSMVSLGLTGLIFAAMIIPNGPQIFGVGIESFLLIFFYFGSMKIITSGQSEVTNAEAAASINESDHHTRAISLKHAKIGFVISSLLIFVTGSALTIAGDHIAHSTGLSSTFVGSFLIAGATSLPEVVTVLVAIQLLNFNLAIGNIVGSNIFNLLILAFIDVLYREGNILGTVSSVSSITALAVMVLNIIFIATILYWQAHNQNSKVYAVPSIMLIIIYGISFYIIFSLS
ncbi:sodium:calcium antiporter [Bacillus shivajii]|uniref:sodium:calcium antiporter n=1 Tax=Bacillus shivajii TaxID=1983719 RepID=UPI001CFAB95E|nr:sodium:calcium antiporter [Bacillus shivajii]UCZ51958.1 sodium:calcium antiporter [Bacillus shivajii]